MSAQSIRLLDFGVVPYLRSQAIYHGIADAMTSDSPDTLVLLSPDRPHFCIGFHQDPRQEIDLEFCRSHDYPVLRRRVGGGTTYLDSNQLYYQFVFHYTRVPARVGDLYKFALDGPVQTLYSLGLNAELRSTNELVANGKRIAGTGAGRIGDASVVVGNFLFDFDYDTMASAWLAPDEEYRRLAREGLDQYITTLRREMAEPPNMEAVKAALAVNVAKSIGRPLERGALTMREEDLACQAEEELASADRLMEIENAPRHGLKIADGVWVHHATCYLLIGGSEGELSVSVRVRDGIIDGITIAPRGGFGGRVWQILASALAGVPLDYEAVKAPLDRFQRAGLVPEEIDLDPLAKTIAKIAKLQ